MGTDDLPPNPLKQALNYNTHTQIHITSVQYYKQQYMQYQTFMRDYMAIKAYELFQSGAAVGVLLSRNLLICLQWLMSSDFLLRVALSGWQIMKNFSSRQRLLWGLQWVCCLAGICSYVCSG